MQKMLIRGGPAKPAKPPGGWEGRIRCSRDLISAATISCGRLSRVWSIQINKAAWVGSLMIGMTWHRARGPHSAGYRSSGARADGAPCGGAVIRCDKAIGDPRFFPEGAVRRAAPERPVRPHLAEPSLAKLQEYLVRTFKFLKAQS